MLRLRDDQWERIREHLPDKHIPEGRPGRKPVTARAVLEAVLWILNTGAQWHMLPPCYPNYNTVHRRYQQWCEREVLKDILTQLANTVLLNECRGLREAYTTTPPRRLSEPDLAAHCAGAEIVVGLPPRQRLPRIVKHEGFHVQTFAAKPPIKTLDEPVLHRLL